MLELLSMCFVVLPLASDPKQEIAVELGNNLVAITESRDAPDQCHIYTRGGDFVIGWSCERLIDRVKAKCD